MKFLCDSTLFDAETGKCWKSTDSFTGYGNGYPEKIVIHNFEDLEDKPKLLYLEHIQYAEMHRKYYQRRTRQNNLLSVMFICRRDVLPLRRGCASGGGGRLRAVETALQE